METFKTTVLIAFATGMVLTTLTAIISFCGGPYASIGILMFWFNFIEIPLLVAFIFVLLYQCIFKRKPVSFFKTPLIYLLLQIGAWVLLGHDEKLGG